MTPSVRALSFLLVLASWILLAGTASAQQFVRNTANVPTSGGSTENVDFADVDNDGDWDAAFADGGDDGNDQNKLWTNNGGAQGGTTGVFTNVTATQLPAISDDSRDFEFGDFDADGDLDAYVSNTAQLTSLNNSNRWWINMGGIQGGTMGFYQDQTSTRWSGLGGPGSSVAPTQLGGNGGFIDFSCDCDFGDLDNDGDLDLFHSTYGGAFGGQVPSRVFLNDGAGVFSEFNPSGFQLPGQTIANGHPGLWCEGTQSSETTDSSGANCDVASTPLDIDLADFDGDLDLDVLHGSRQSAPRIFKNRLEESGGTLVFRDVTGVSFVAGYWTGGNNYEQEVGDFDGDGDIDIYGLNWPGLNDSVMPNDGTGYFPSFAVLASSGSDDNEGDFIDYDCDGDIDLFIANFSGQERMYNNNGSGSYTFQTTGSVLPSDSTTSLDADMCDVDGDGDYDVFVANDNGTAEWYLMNTTLANDVTAAMLHSLEQAPDRAAGASPTVVRVRVLDNAAYYTTWYNNVRLEVQVNAGPIVTYPMRMAGGELFRGEISGNLVGTITYRALSTDKYGNTGQTAIQSYVASAGAGPGINFCSPGLAGVIACPCSNPPSGANRGCDNSSATGGAQLSSVGTASLGSDSVVFTATGEKPTATTIFLQGDAVVGGGGAVFGQGVRCVGGSLKRLYVKNAVGGTVTAPVGGDLSVSARSAALGDTITGGATRWYMTYYRDPVVLGGCPAASTFNSTQGQSVLWAN